MKKILFILCLFCSTLVLADSTSSIIPTIPDSAKATFHQVYQDVKEGLTGLAEGLKVGVQEVWRILVLKQFAIAVLNSLIFIGSIILTIVFLVGMKKLYILCNSEGDHPGFIMPCILGSMGCLTLFIFSLFGLEQAVLGFIVPEYGAIQEIMSFVKQ